jgi:predicted anti-sigma-YlaC factor YlaD
MAQSKQSASSELTCQELVELVTDYLENALPPPERARFEAHLGYCAGCRTYLDQIRLTAQTIGRLTEDALEPSTRAELLEVFRNWKRGH